MFIKSLAVTAALLMIPAAAQAKSHANSGNSGVKVQAYTASQAIPYNAANQRGTWTLNPSACPDLREDRRDARVTTSRRDAREDIRDSRTVNCPVSAWSYTPARGENLRGQRVVYSGPRVVQVQGPGNYRVLQVNNTGRNVQPIKRRQSVKTPTSINIVIR